VLQSGDRSIPKTGDAASGTSFPSQHFLETLPTIVCGVQAELARTQQNLDAIQSRVEMLAKMSRRWEELGLNRCHLNMQMLEAAERIGGDDEGGIWQ
jgi:hypothetical protein